MRVRGFPRTRFFYRVQLPHPEVFLMNCLQHFITFGTFRSQQLQFLMTIKTSFLSALLLLAFTGVSYGQSFTAVSDGFINVGRSSLAWGDYDNDGDLDLLLSGDPVNGSYTMKIYRNDAGTFTDINANLTGVYNSAVSWGDFDGDGDLDILATGRSASNSNTWLFRNKSGEFVPVNAGFPAVGSDGAVAWGDYDGDGDLDALIAGNFSCRLFNNNGGVFTDVNAELPPINNGWVDWGDFDNDGDLDIFVMGDLGGVLVSDIYRNDEDFFTAMGTGIMPLSGGTASWCDVDNDHDLDLLVNGFDEYLEPKTLIYQNLGGMQFFCMIPGMVNSSLGTVAWGDYDNDGDADALITGQNPACGSLSSVIYRNDGGYMFTNISAGLAGVERGCSTWGDYDNDGDLDIVLSGSSESGSPITALYRNNAGSNVFQENTPPLAPAGLTSTVSGHQVLLAWNQATDDHTPTQALTYNLRIGTTPGGNEIIACMANSADGHRLISQPGNVSNDTSWVVNLPDGNYYWSIQALDQAFLGSQFAGEQQFTVLNAGILKNENPAVCHFQNPFSDQLSIRSEGKFRIQIRDSFGRIVYTGDEPEFHHEIETACWPSGVYLLNISGEKGNYMMKAIRK